MIDTSYIYTYLYVFNRRTQMSLYSLLLIHPHIISQLGSHPFKKLQDAYCPHVPRPHHENISQLQSRSEMVLFQLKSVEGHLLSFWCHLCLPWGWIRWHFMALKQMWHHMSSCLGFVFWCPSCWKNIQQQLYLYILRTLMYYVLQRYTKTIYSMQKIYIYIYQIIWTAPQNHMFFTKATKRNFDKELPLPRQGTCIFESELCIPGRRTATSCWCSAPGGFCRSLLSKKHTYHKRYATWNNG